MFNQKTPEKNQGWNWLSESRDNKNTIDKELTASFARCFSTRDGEKVMAYLEKMTVQRSLSPEVGTSSLWYLEGQRGLVALIKNMKNKGLNLHK